MLRVDAAKKPLRTARRHSETPPAASRPTLGRESGGSGSFVLPPSYVKKFKKNSLAALKRKPTIREVTIEDGWNGHSNNHNNSSNNNNIYNISNTSNNVSNSNSNNSNPGNHSSGRSSSSRRSSSREKPLPRHLRSASNDSSKRALQVRAIRSPKLGGYRDPTSLSAADRLAAYLKEQANPAVVGGPGDETGESSAAAFILSPKTRVFLGPAGCLQSPALHPQMAANSFRRTWSREVNDRLHPRSAARRVSDFDGRGGDELMLKKSLVSMSLAAARKCGAAGAWEFSSVAATGEFAVVMVDFSYMHAPSMISGNSAFCDLVERDPWRLAGRPLRTIIDTASHHALLKNNAYGSFHRAVIGQETPSITRVHLTLDNGFLCAFAIARRLENQLLIVILPAPGCCSATERQMVRSRPFRAMLKKVHGLLLSENVFEESGLA